MSDNDTVGEPSKEDDNIDIRKIVESGYINFLFGAGVNGKAFQNFGSGFPKTKDKLKSKNKAGKSIEDELKELVDTDFDEVIETLVSEFNEADVDTKSESYENLKGLIQETNKLIDKTENRQAYKMRANIFTLNYDRVVENILDDSGLLYQSITAKKMGFLPGSDIVGYDPAKKRYVPTYAVFKLHGSVDFKGKLHKDDIILPSKDKRYDVLSREFFGVLFKMRSELMKRDSVLFIIGYSGADEDVNHIVRESIQSGGLSVYWLKYNKEDTGMERHSFNIETIQPHPIKPDGDEYQDTTKTLADMLRKANCS